MCVCLYIYICVCVERELHLDYNCKLVHTPEVGIPSKATELKIAS